MGTCQALAFKNRGGVRQRESYGEEHPFEDLPRETSQLNLKTIRHKPRRTQVANSADAANLSEENETLVHSEMFRAHAPRLYQTAFRILRNREDAEDALQECWLSAIVNLSSFEGRSSVSTWLTRIVINAALMILRKKNRARELPLDPGECPNRYLYVSEFHSPGPNPEESFLEVETKNIVRDSLDGLRPRVRAVIELTQLGELSLKETAKTLGISVTATKARLFHARALLRKSRGLRAHAGTPLTPSRHGDNW